jgi:hypothetical protein
LPEAIEKMYEYQMGTWQVTARVGDKKVKGKWTCRWARGKHCFLITSQAESPEGDGATLWMASVGGYDSVKKQTIEKIFWSDDRHYTIRYDVSSPIFDAGVFEGETEGIVGGQDFKAHVKVERKGPDEFVYTSKSADGAEVQAIFKKMNLQKRKEAPRRK